MPGRSRGDKPVLDLATHDAIDHLDRAPGCEECAGTGFVGRTVVAELLDMSDNIRQMILERRPVVEMKQAAREEGMSFLRDSALEKVFAGITTLREINKVTFVA